MLRLRSPIPPLNRETKTGHEDAGRLIVVTIFIARERTYSPACASASVSSNLFGNAFLFAMLRAGGEPLCHHTENFAVNYRGPN